MDVGDARRRRRHVVFLILFELKKVEVIAAVLLLFGASERFLGNREERKARRQSQRLLAAGEKHVNPECVHRDRDGGEGRDAIDDQRDLRIFPDDGTDFRDRIHDAGRSFIVDQRNGIEIAGREFFVEGSGIDVLAPIDLERLGFFAATAADLEPFVGERAAHAVEDAAGNEIADRRFHHAPG